jgi:nucleotidyltransferase substrate binding protein (TIGR01987 family)
MNEDICWKQRFEHFDRTLKRFESFATYQKTSPTDVAQVALIGAFTFTFELGWKTIKDYLTYNGVDVSLPRDVIKQGF